MEIQIRQSDYQAADIKSEGFFRVERTESYEQQQGIQTIDKTQANLSVNKNQLEKFLQKAKKIYSTHCLKICLFLLIVIFLFLAITYSNDNILTNTQVQDSENQTQKSENNYEKIQNSKYKKTPQIPQKHIQNSVKQNSNGTMYIPIFLSDYPAALCLDGTPGVYHISNNSYEDRTKFYLFFQGGGWCGDKSQASTLQNCYERSKLGTGSSKYSKKQFTQVEGFSSTDERNNFKNWTKVILKYCDGSGHQGTRKQPVQYKGDLLYFRGHNITVAQFQSLEKNYKIFTNATQIVVSGTSAGGLAAYMWTNYVVERAKKAKIWSLPDSGIFLNFKNVVTGQQEFKNSIKNIMKFTNSEIDPPVPKCIQKFKDSKVECFFAQNIYMYVQAPTFHLQSLYDRWSIENILNITCDIIKGQKSSIINCTQTERTEIQKYHEKLTEIVLKMAKKAQSGVWAPSCVDHVYLKTRYFSPDFRIPQNSQFSASESVRIWMYENKDKNTHIDLQNWPSNKPCSGL